MYLSTYHEQKGIVTSYILTACLNLCLHSNEKNACVSVILESKGLIHRVCGALFINDLCLCIKGSGAVCVCISENHQLPLLSNLYKINIYQSEPRIAPYSMRAKYFIFSSFTHGREHDRLKCLHKSHLKWS